MSKYSDEIQDPASEDEYEDEIATLDNIGDLPESRPDFTREPGKKTTKGFNPESVNNASQIPTANIVNTQRGPVVNIDNQTFDITQFRPEIIEQIKRRQEMERTYQQQYPPQHDPRYPPPRTQHPPPQQPQHPQPQYPPQHLPQHDPRYPPQHDPRYPPQEYYTQPTNEIPTKESVLEKQRQGKGKVIDLTDNNLSLVDDGSSYSRVKPKFHDKTMLTPLFVNWNKTGLIFILILVLMNPYISELIISKIPYISGPYVSLLFKSVLIVITYHLINGYLLE